MGVSTQDCLYGILREGEGGFSSTETGEPEGGELQEQSAPSATPSIALLSTPEAAKEQPEAAGQGMTVTVTSAPQQTISAWTSPSPEVASVSSANGLSGMTGFLIAAILFAAWAATLIAFISGRRKKPSGGRAASEAPRMRPSGLNAGNLHNIGMRSNQEDSFAISDLSNAELLQKHGVLAVVADGMGGLENGEVISAAVTASFMRSLPELPERLTPAQKLLTLAYRANVEAKRAVPGSGAQSGSTLVATLIQNGLLWFLSIGDSRICLFRDGGAVQLTREHVYAADLDLRAARDAAGYDDAVMDAQRHALTSYIGMPEPEHIDFNLHPVRLLAGDWVVLMSDGVFNTLTDEEIASALHGNVHEAACTMEDLVLRRQTAQQDNFTSVFFQIT